MSSANRPTTTLTLSRPLDRLTTERLEQLGVGQAPLEPELQAPPPDGAHHQHVPADASTLAWNRAREAEWHAAPAALEAMLRELAPAVFNDSPPPLAIGTGAVLVALLAGEFEAGMVSRFLADWTRRRAYLEALARGDVRRDLDGCPTDVPDEDARVFAAELVRRLGVVTP
jgi:hypothetical protein